MPGRLVAKRRGGRQPPRNRRLRRRRAIGPPRVGGSVPSPRFLIESRSRDTSRALINAWLGKTAGAVFLGGGVFRRKTRGARGAPQHQTSRPLPLSTAC